MRKLRNSIRYIPLEHVGSSNPVPVQSQVKVPGVLVQDPLLQGVPVAHSFISVGMLKK